MFENDPTPEPRRELGVIQRWMQAVITHPGGVVAGMDSAEARSAIPVGPNDVEAVITRSRALSAVDRLEIYARAYYARLIECLRAEFPVLVHALGEDLFDEFAVGYLERYPSRSYTLNLLGAGFPRYLDETRPSDESWAEVVVDLANLELAVAQVFDGPGVEDRRALDFADLSAIPPERWAEARFVPVPCLRLLGLRYPIRAYYTALRDGVQSTPPARSDSFLALTRRNYVVRIHELQPREHDVLSALCEGRTVESAVRVAAETPGPDLTTLADDLRRWFHVWAVAGFFQAVELR